MESAHLLLPKLQNGNGLRVKSALGSYFLNIIPNGQSQGAARPALLRDRRWAKPIIGHRSIPRAITGCSTPGAPIRACRGLPFSGRIRRFLLMQLSINVPFYSIGVQWPGWRQPPAGPMQKSAAAVRRPLDCVVGQ
jgi:hypothetical protein